MGMEIKEIKRFVDLEQQGDSTLAERIEILENQIRMINQRMNNLRKYIQTLKTS
ncbi:hypothetical protein RV02_GL002952 [Enterococcus gilvus]|nr:hypothetical protein RV02_GL002952 [Enterococcus gilvus]